MTSQARNRTNGATMPKPEQADTPDAVQVDAIEAELPEPDRVEADSPAPTTSREDAVRAVQRDLAVVDVDGVIGPQTVRAFQRARGLRVTGVIDQDTRDPLEQAIQHGGL